MTTGGFHSALITSNAPTALALRIQPTGHFHVGCRRFPSLFVVFGRFRVSPKPTNPMYRRLL